MTVWLNSRGRFLDAGFTVIVDAAFLRRSCRARFASLADSIGVPFRIVACEAPHETLRRRLSGRSGDASDADVSVLELQLQSAESLATEERRYLLPRTGLD